MAAKTSEGQWTPRTRRETATSEVQIAAMTIAKLPHRGQIFPIHCAAAVDNADVPSACPLEKLDPRYHCVSHKAGRVRSTIIFSVYTTSGAVSIAVRRNAASTRCRAMNSAAAVRAD